jgi:hypothetical protein
VIAAAVVPVWVIEATASVIGMVAVVVSSAWVVEVAVRVV